MADKNTTTCDTCHGPLQRMSVWNCPGCKTYLAHPNDSNIVPVDPAATFAQLKSEIHRLTVQFTTAESKYKAEIEDLKLQVQTLRNPALTDVGAGPTEVNTAGSRRAGRRHQPASSVMPPSR